MNKLSLFLGLVLAQLDSIDRAMLFLNSRGSKVLEALSRTEKYSRIRLEGVKECSQTTKCTLFSCMFRGRSIFSGGTVDLLEVKEVFTGYSGNSAQAWKDIRDAAEGNRILSTLVSGIHYSVTTHLSSFHRKILGCYLSNPVFFRKKYEDIYRLNFYLCYIFTRRCIGNVRLGGMKEEKELSRAIRTGKNKVEDADDAIERLEKIVGIIECIECERCRLWGKIQFEGLKAGLSGRRVLSDSEKIYLVNLYMRLSVALVESIRLRTCWMPFLRTVPLHWAKILGCLICYIVYCVGSTRFRRGGCK
jgi:ERO1-like protein alpha